MSVIYQEELVPIYWLKLSRVLLSFGRTLHASPNSIILWIYGILACVRHDNKMKIWRGVSICKNVLFILIKDNGTYCIRTMNLCVCKLKLYETDTKFWQCKQSNNVLKSPCCEVGS